MCMNCLCVKVFTSCVEQCNHYIMFTRAKHSGDIIKYWILITDCIHNSLFAETHHGFATYVDVVVRMIR